LARGKGMKLLEISTGNCECLTLERGAWGGMGALSKVQSHHRGSSAAMMV
jgi:hypothetical protein